MHIHIRHVILNATNFGGRGSFYKTSHRQRVISLSNISEDLNLNRAIQGDHEAFGMLYEQYVERIFNYVYYRTGNQHDAEDLTARVFFRAMRRIPQYQERGLPVSAWLYRIAHNLVANWHRDRGRRPEISLDEGFASIPHSEHPARLYPQEQRVVQRQFP